jgi:hypothetical protein
MIVVKPEVVGESNLLSSSIPEPDAGEISWQAGTYTLGTQRIKSSTHRIYEVVAESTDDDPEVGVLADPKTWIDVGATNKWKMFDGIIGSQSVGFQNVEILNSPIVNCVAGFNITGASSIRVVVFYENDLVYDREKTMIDESVVGGWYDYLFSPVIAETRFIFTDLPTYPEARVNVIATGDDVAFGELITGLGVDIGVTQFGTGWQGLDFSKKERDSFGGFSVIAGQTADLLDYDIKIDRTRFGYVKSVIKSLTGIPTVWIGNPKDTSDGTAVYGYYRDAQINFTSPSLIDMTVQVEGLI